MFDETGGDNSSTVRRRLVNNNMENERTLSNLSAASNSVSQRQQQQDAMMQLLAPDGYYTYLGIEKVRVADHGAGGGGGEGGTAYTVDEDAVKKAYRKLSRKHHPDKGGDVNTFRLLNRAQRVLMHPKLRAQYDNLGIDLDDDEEEEKNLHDNASENNTNNGDLDEKSDKKNNHDHGNGISQGIVSELASMALTGIIQLAIRTLLMGLVAVFVTRYRITAYPALAFMAYVVFNVVAKATVRGGSVYDTGISIYDAVSPALIMVGLIFMMAGRTLATADTEAKEWTWTFWVGESMVLALFTYNSISSIPWSSNPLALFGLSVAAGLLALVFRGKFYHYLIVIVVELVLAILVAMAFPIMELLLEAILNEKLKKVGEKVRAHHRQLEQYYQDKYNKES